MNIQQAHGDALHAMAEARSQHENRREAITTALGQILSQERERFGWSAADIADVAGCHPHDVMEVEAGRFMPSEKMINVFIGMQLGSLEKPDPDPDPPPRVHLQLILSSPTWHPRAACGTISTSLGIGAAVNCPACMATLAWTLHRTAITKP